MQGLDSIQQSIVDNLHQLTKEDFCHPSRSIIHGKTKEHYYKIIDWLQSVVGKYNSTYSQQPFFIEKDFHIGSNGKYDKCVIYKKSQHTDQRYLDKFTIVCLKPFITGDPEKYKPPKQNKHGQILINF